MRTFKRILAGLLILLAVVAIAGYFFVNIIAKKALPDYDKPVQLSGLIDEVSVYRDAQAVPHIYAKNEHDLYLTTGYLMAQDRLWQMDLLRRVTMGRLSEIFGEDMIGADHLLRALRIPEKSQMVLSGSDENLILALQAFANGVNQFIETNQKKLSPEFTILGYKPEPWEPIHTVNLIGYMAWDLAGSWQTEITLYKLMQKVEEEKFAQLIPDLNRHRTLVHPAIGFKSTSDMFELLEHNKKLQELGLEIFSGSNNWAVAGSKSETGHPILLNDMHLGFGAPGIWYQIHQVIEGQLNVTGVALPGAPVIVVGHNANIAWGMTNLYVDEMDFYLETLSDDGTKYLLDDEWLDLEVVQEMIITKKGDTVMKEIQFTHRGPIVSGFKKVGDQAISKRWTGNDYSNELRSIYLLNRARNWDEFRDALSTFGAVSQNVNYADVDGNIGMQTAGAVPMRNAGNPILPLPGNTREYDWTGMIPFEELPFTYNPPEGYVASANNRTVGDEYPYYIGYWYDMPFRIERIREMLEEKEKLGVEDFKVMLADFKSKAVEEYIDDLVQILSLQTDLSSNERKAMEMLAAWDMVLTKESSEASIFEQFYQTFIRNILVDEMGEDLYREFGGGLIRNMFDRIWKNPESSWVNNIHTDEFETFEEMVVMSFRETIQWLEVNMGADPDTWKWGEIHQLGIKHPMGSVKILDRIFGLNKGPFPVGGSFHTVNPKAYSFHNPYAVLHGASQRHIFNMGNMKESYVVIPTGTSGIPASKYYVNQIEMFINNQYKKDLWLKQDVMAGAKYHAIFSPR
jgi:penicillin G amidase